MIKELIRLANHLDSKGFNEEADYLDVLIEKVPPDAVLEGKTSDKLLSLSQVYGALNSFINEFKSRGELVETKEVISSFEGLRGELEHQAAISCYQEPPEEGSE